MSFTPQMPATVRPGPGRSQELRLQFGSPTWMTVTQLPEPSLLPSECVLQDPGAESRARLEPRHQGAPRRFLVTTLPDACLQKDSVEVSREAPRKQTRDLGSPFCGLQHNLKKG